MTIAEYERRRHSMLEAIERFWQRRDWLRQQEMLAKIEHYWQARELIHDELEQELCRSKWLHHERARLLAALTEESLRVPKRIVRKEAA